MVYPYIDILGHKKRNEILIHVTILLNLEIIILIETSQTQMTAYCMKGKWEFLMGSEFLFEMTKKFWKWTTS